MGKYDYLYGILILRYTTILIIHILYSTKYSTVFSKRFNPIEMNM